MEFCVSRRQDARRRVVPLDSADTIASAKIYLGVFLKFLQPLSFRRRTPHGESRVHVLLNRRH